MDKYDFIKQLETELSGLSQEEISEAVGYYKELFEDAGSENEQELISNLGSPKEIAESIKRESGAVAVVEAHKSQQEEAQTSDEAADTTKTTVSSGNRRKRREVRRDGGTMLLLLIIALLTSPVWLPLLIAFYAVIIALLFTILVVAIVFGALGIGGIISGLSLLLPVPPAGLVLLGLGLLFTAITVACAPFLFKGIFFVCRGVLNGTIAIFHSIFYKKEAVCA